MFCFLFEHDIDTDDQIVEDRRKLRLQLTVNEIHKYCPPANETIKVWDYLGGLANRF